MSRSGYTDDFDDQWALIRWRGAVTSAIRGKRGQEFLREMAAAMDAMPEKSLSQKSLNTRVRYARWALLGKLAASTCGRLIRKIETQLLMRSASLSHWPAKSCTKMTKGASKKLPSNAGNGCVHGSSNCSRRGQRERTAYSGLYVLGNARLQLPENRL